MGKGKPRFISRPRRYSNMDNSKYITVRLNDEQYALLREYMEKNSLKQTTYFRKLIDGEAITVEFRRRGSDPYAAANMIYSNVRQIARNPLALSADEESVKRLVLLSDKLGKLFSEILNF